MDITLTFANWLLNMSKSIKNPNHKLRLVVSESGNFVKYKYVKDKSEQDGYVVSGESDNYALFYDDVANEMDLKGKTHEEIDGSIDNDEIDIWATNRVTSFLRTNAINDALAPDKSTFRDLDLDPKTIGAAVIGIIIVLAMFM